MSSAVPPVGDQKVLPKSDKAKCPSTNTSTTCSVPTSGAAKHSQPIPLVHIASKPEGKTTQGTSLASYSSTATSSGVAEYGKLAAAKRNLEMLRKAKKSANPTSYSAKRGSNVLQAYLEHEKVKARKGNTQQEVLERSQQHSN